VLAAQESPPARIVALAERFDGARVGLLCGYFEGGPADTPVVDAVPAYLLWRRREDFPAPLAELMSALVACAHDETRGGGQVLERLCELLLHMILREPQVLRHDRLGFLRAQRDPVLRRVFDAIHARPGRPWTLTTLARSAGISRSALAARFKEQAGIPAMHYLRRYRVQLGERRMHEDGWSAKQVARALGYNSVSAFRRAARRA
jgi:AraC-like DNA-binding protein